MSEAAGGDGDARRSTGEPHGRPDGPQRTLGTALAYAAAALSERPVSVCWTSTSPCPSEP
ncbi:MULTISPECIES: hypothetical protein [unclassified Streptomyces]|uniref:hypothetical protein n=1 Tax=unclassified Streptomyces TaxID=2593676 RepID=UPI00367D0427